MARFRKLVTANDPRLADVLFDLAEIQARSGTSPKGAAREALEIWGKIGYEGRERLARARELSAS